MATLTLDKLQKYFSASHGDKVRVLRVGKLGEKEEKPSKPSLELKGFGYGVPYLVDFEVEGKRQSVVLETMKQDSFGHDHMSDRAQNLLLAHFTYNKLLKHVKSLDLGVLTKDGSLKSVGDCVEFFILLEKAEGKEYYHDLEEIRARKSLSGRDVSRCKALSDYLVRIHARKGSSPELYRRRIRELIGHGECIMGLVDNYPQETCFVSRDELRRVERRCVDWRWKVRDKVHRLCQVHGDFHPWNVIFRDGTDFTVLDRSRGEWGEAADDVSSMSINYLFYSLQTYGELAGEFKDLFNTFTGNYLDQTGDDELLTVVQPFYAWRALVLASPVWYPTLGPEVRIKLLNFINNILDTEKLELRDINTYLK